MEILDAEVEYLGIVFCKPDHEIAFPAYDAANDVRLMGMIYTGHRVGGQLAAAQRAEIPLSFQHLLVLLLGHSIRMQQS